MGSLMIFLISFSGPVGSYLGIYEGKWARDTFFYYDSIRHLYPDTFIEIIDDAGIVCESIVQETLWQGNIAYIRETFRELSFLSKFNLLPIIFFKGKMFENNLQDSEDTLFEYGNKLCRSFTWDTVVVQETLYKTPFSLNLFWRSGLNRYRLVLDIDGEGLLNDTVTFLGDSSRVIGIENVLTPYGLIPNAYKIRTHLIVRIHGVDDIYRWRDTIRIFNIQWYKDSLWQVKDSSFLRERYWFRETRWYLMFDRIGIYRTWLWSASISISEEVNNLKVVYLNKPLSIDLNGGEVSLINTLGQVIYKKRGVGKIILDNKRYKKGIYYLKIRDKEGERLFKLVNM